MSQDSDPKSNPVQSNKNKRSCSKVTTTHLKLVASNSFPASVQGTASTRARNPNAGFTTEVRVMGPSLYSLAASDPSHYLECDLTLDVEENLDGTGLETVTCHFPDILDDELDDFVWEDETLLGIILVQFQMKILRQLLLFCVAHKAKNLIIRFDESLSEKIEVFQEVVVYEDHIPAKEGKLIEWTIPANQKTFDHWIHFMNEAGQRFRGTIWQDHGSNPAIRWYLKLNPSLSLFR